MESVRPQNSKWNPEAAQWAVSPVFSVQGTPCWGDEKVFSSPACPDWVNWFLPGSVAIASPGLSWLGAAAAADRYWTLEGWSRNSGTNLVLSGDCALLDGCRITVSGMIVAEGRNRFPDARRETRPVRREFKAMPTGRAICLSHQQLNL